MFVEDFSASSTRQDASLYCVQTLLLSGFASFKLVFYMCVCTLFITDASLPTAAQRLELMSQYYFVLITEDVVQEGWVHPFFSQALLAGAVPVCAPSVFEAIAVVAYTPVTSYVLFI